MLLKDEEGWSGPWATLSSGTFWHRGNDDVWWFEFISLKIRPGASALDDHAKAKSVWIIESQNVLVKDCNFNQRKKQFTKFLDHNKIWRCGGWIQKADYVSFCAQHQILLHNSHNSHYIAGQTNPRKSHGGLKSTLIELRSWYWIVKGRNVIKRILSYVWRKAVHRSLFTPTAILSSPNLRPFAYTGGYFAGPLFVKSAKIDSSKAWIYLFTWYVTRAVHLILVTDLTTSTFLRSTKWFTARQGLPMRMIADNSRIFKAAAKVLKIIMDQPDIQWFLTGLHIHWCFNLPKAPR